MQLEDKCSAEVLCKVWEGGALHDCTSWPRSIRPAFLQLFCMTYQLRNKFLAVNSLYCVQRYYAAFVARTLHTSTENYSSKNESYKCNLSKCTPKVYSPIAIPLYSLHAESATQPKVVTVQRLTGEDDSVVLCKHAYMCKAERLQNSNNGQLQRHSEVHHSYFMNNQ